MDEQTRTIHQVAADLRRRQDRERKPLHTRLKEAVGRAALLSGVESAQGSDAGYTTTGKTGSKPPAGVAFTQDGDIRTTPDPFPLERYLSVIEHHVERLELAIDAEQGLSENRHHIHKTGDELDEEILGWEGTASHIVATKAPWLGSPRTIENVRAKHGRRRIDGKEQQLRAA